MARRSRVGSQPLTDWPPHPHTRKQPSTLPAERLDPATAGLHCAPSKAGRRARSGLPDAVRGSVDAGFIVAAALVVFPEGVAAQANCAVSDNAYICNVPAGTYDTPQFFDQPASSIISVMGIGVNSFGEIGLTSSSPQVENMLAGVGVIARGSNSPSGDIYGVTAVSQGSIAIQTDATVSLDNSVFGIFAYNFAYEAGSSYAGANVTNSAPIVIDLPSVTSPAGAGIWAGDRGGEFGGNATGASVVNSGGITVSMSGSEGFAGIQAASFGGGNSNDGGHGGIAGNASVTTSAPVSVTWNWQGAGSQNNGVYGVQALSQGGNGGSNDGGNGGNGGTAGSASVTLEAGGDVSVTVSGTPPTGSAYSAGVLAAVFGGNGGVAGNGRGFNGGFGAGIAGPSQIQITDATVLTSGDSLPGVLGVMQAGNGASAGCQLGIDCTTGGSKGEQNGGYGGQVTGAGQVNVTAFTEPVTISTTGADSAAVQLMQIGGVGGNGGSDQTIGGGTAGSGGGGGAVTGTATVTLGGSGPNTIALSTAGDSSPGIYVISQGGNGGLGGGAWTSFFDITAGDGGSGGEAGAVNVSLTGTSIATEGASSPGIYALSLGGVGAAGGDAGGAIGGTYGGAGGNGGDSGAVTVTLDGASTIATVADDAAGILAQSFSGAGGNAGSANGGGSHGPGGGSGGAAGAVTVTNDAVIVTSGDAARGILAQSMAGTGGGGGYASGIVDHGGTGGSAGAVGAVSVFHNGLIVTSGSNAHGVLMQSVGGSGGAGGTAAGGFSSVGGSADDTPFSAAGNSVTFTSAGGIIATNGISSTGVLGQSIGGGGGDGGGASGGTASVGGSGGGGGNGGTVTATLGTDTHIVTQGGAASAVVMQSIGGGGGNAGNASSDGLFTSVAIGGSGGIGGNGGAATITANGLHVDTSGSTSAGLLAQSIGGGGGTGGRAYSGAVGPLGAVAVSVGGSGGQGGGGDTASITVADGSRIATGQGSCPTSPCNTLPVNSYGVVVQSIGGGGGLGGSATAEAVAIAIPVTQNTQVGLAVGSAVGGTGGNGGNGGTAQFSLSNNSAIETSGQGSTAVVAQSVGGGGGIGGNSSAAAAVIGYDYTPEDGASLAVTATFTMGGQGGVGGDGGDVLVALGGTIASDGTFSQDPAGTAGTSIVTYGDYSNGVTAQSIGGGGGDAGYGSGNTQSFGTSTSTSISVGLGSKGGSGGAGGEVEAYLYGGSSVTTYGSGSVGILAQSVGGGGGSSQGGSLSFAQSFNVDEQDYKPGLNLNLGMQGAGGGAGGDVSVTVDGAIATHGGDATGVLAQSIGGGGGLGGSAGADASADNPVVAGLAAREGTSEVANFLQNYFEGQNQTLPTVDATFSLSIGGSGGTGGDGGTVAVDLSAPITTLGDWASGIVAQSIGGGGGKGGTSAASGTGGIPEITINLDVALGGNGGAGGDGGDVTIQLDEGDTTIRTGGYAAAAVVAQSVGGGGGMGADGSDSATGLISVGGSGSSIGGGSGDGGSVTLQYQTSVGAIIATSGDAADGVVLQSVGGGGGIGGAGSSLYVSEFRKQGATLNLWAGGALGVDGNGGDVTVEQVADNALSIETTGDYSLGLLAQSVGGGGGLVTAQPSADEIYVSVGGNFSTGSGGTVEVTATGITVNTQGIAAHGIVAQSIGGGGGYVRVTDSSSEDPSLTTTFSAAGMQGSGSGGDVNLYVGGGGSVSVSGPGAIGILAQSIGGGGGVTVTEGSISTGSSAVFLNNCPSCTGEGGDVSVWVSGNVSATGTNGIGIFAQSAGPSGNGTISVSPINSSVTGGSGTAATPTQSGAAGIQIDGGSFSNTVETAATGVISTVLGTSGTAILQTGNGSTNVSNYGTVIGSAYLGGGKFTNLQNGVHETGAMNDGDYVNHGTVDIGLPGETRTTRITGDFVQTADGRLGVTIDSVKGAVSHLQVDGSASIDGLIVPTAVTLLPGSVSVVSAGDLASTADGADSLVFHWHAAQSGNTISITPHSDFSADGVEMTASQASLARHFARAWENADEGFATHFATLSHILEPGDYTAALDEYSSKDIYAQSLALMNSAGGILGSSMSCPVFVEKTVLLKEDDCLWLSVTGRWSDQDAKGDIQGYDVTSTTYRIGAQHAIATDWYLGGSFAYGRTSASMDGGSSGDGDTFDGSVTLKHTPGPWLFAASVALAHGSFDVNRQVNLPGYTYPLESDPSIFLAGARLRVGYQFNFGDWYARPYGDLDIVYSDMSAVREKGSPLYALDMDRSRETDVRLSLMTEFGGRIDLDAQTTLRPYAAIGITYLPDNVRTVDGRFATATTDNGTFTDHLKMPEFLGRLDVGMQLYNSNGFEVRAGYTADFGESYVSQTASARLAYHF